MCSLFPQTYLKPIAYFLLQNPLQDALFICFGPILRNGTFFVAVRVEVEDIGMLKENGHLT